MVLDHAWFRREGTLWQQGKVGERVGIRDQTAQFRPSYAITVDSGTDSSGRAPHGRGQDWCFINESNHETTGRMQVRRILFVFFSLKRDRVIRFPKNLRTDPLSFCHPFSFILSGYQVITSCLFKNILICIFKSFTIL